MNTDMQKLAKDILKAKNYNEYDHIPIAICLIKNNGYTNKDVAKIKKKKRGKSWEIDIGSRGICYISIHSDFVKDIDALSKWLQENIYCWIGYPENIVISP